MVPLLVAAHFSTATLTDSDILQDILQDILPFFCVMHEICVELIHKFGHLGIWETTRKTVVI